MGSARMSDRKRLLSETVRDGLSAPELGQLEAEAIDDAIELARMGIERARSMNHVAVASERTSTTTRPVSG